MRKISYEIQDSATVTVKVVDIIGTTVKKMINEHDKPGIYEVNLDSGSFPIGKYYYKVFVKNGSIENEGTSPDGRLLSSGQFKI